MMVRPLSNRRWTCLRVGLGTGWICTAGHFWWRNAIRSSLEGPGITSGGRRLGDDVRVNSLSDCRWTCFRIGLGTRRIRTRAVMGRSRVPWWRRAIRSGFGDIRGLRNNGDMFHFSCGYVGFCIRVESDAATTPADVVNDYTRKNNHDEQRSDRHSQGRSDGGFRSGRGNRVLGLSCVNRDVVFRCICHELECPAREYDEGTDDAFHGPAQGD